MAKSTKSKTESILNEAAPAKPARRKAAPPDAAAPESTDMSSDASGDGSDAAPTKKTPAARKAAPAKKAAAKKAAAKKSPAKKTATKTAAKPAARKTSARAKSADGEDEDGISAEIPVERLARSRGAKSDPAERANGRILVIVESPAKARTIEKYLGPRYKVVASVGHVIDLPVSALGVDVEDNFRPQYVVIKGKKQIIDRLRQEARTAPEIYLAPDPDREGEAIAYHIASVLPHGGEGVHRAIFNEITKDAILSAIKNPTEVNQNLVNAQQARRILDRLVGYKISPLLWRKVKRGLSAGRVQSVALRIICDREREIRAFKPEEYWTIEADAKASKPPMFRLKLDKIDGKKASVPNQASADKIIGDVQGKPFIVDEVTRREVRRRPLPPFITSTLQQEASRRLRHTARRTMQIAQRLYEGVELGAEGPQGLITYMRTDSTRLSGYALDQIRLFIKDQFGGDYVPEAPRFYTKGKSAQDAHEAIRPTDINNTPDKVAPYLDKDQLALYRLIWNRALACQMTDALFESVRVDVPVEKRYLFMATGSVLKFAGHLKIYEESRDEIGRTESDENAEGGRDAEPGAGANGAAGGEGANPDGNAEGAGAGAGDRRLPAMEKGDKLDVPKVEGLQHFTQPPPRFTEAGLIKELEKQGIGRPSTYATIISTIQGKEYTEKDGGVFKPTDLGFIVTDLLIEGFPQIMDVKFTAMMESQLDQVEEGKVNWVELLRNFYTPFEKKLEAANAQMRNLKAEIIQTEFTCEKCGSPMVVRWGRMGRFLACSAYPECRNTKPIVEGEDGKFEIVKEEVSGRKCPNCGKEMVVKSGRRGRFLACSGYPECKTSQPLPINVPCPRPGCSGELVERRSAKGKTFWSCSAYPECKFSVWELPRKVACETCNEEKFSIGKDSKLRMFGCARADCPHASAYNPEAEAAAAAGEGGAEGEATAKPKGRRFGARKG